MSPAQRRAHYIYEKAQGFFLIFIFYFSTTTSHIIPTNTIYDYLKFTVIIYL